MVFFETNSMVFGCLFSTQKPLDIREWDKKPTADKTHANFHAHFTAANKERAAVEQSITPFSLLGKNCHVH